VDVIPVAKEQSYGVIYNTPRNEITYVAVSVVVDVITVVTVEVRVYVICDRAGKGRGEKQGIDPIVEASNVAFQAGVVHALHAGSTNRVPQN
tara:strand:- start:51 stop:326 length:276 start_codon:yes stop_codon:yes gene_type:complete